MALVPDELHRIPSYKILCLETRIKLSVYLVIVGFSPRESLTLVYGCSLDLFMSHILPGLF